jgi:hypothetical protein
MSGVADSRGGDESEEDCADDYSGNRQTTATLTGLLDLVQSEKTENQTQERPDDAQPPDRGAQQRRDGHPVRAGAWWRRWISHRR